MPAGPCGQWRGQLRAGSDISRRHPTDGRWMDGVHLTTEDNRGRTGQHATDRQPTTCGGRGAYIAQQATQQRTTRHWPRRGTLARPAAECCQDCLASLVARTCAQVFVWSITSQAVLQVIEAPEAGACVRACAGVRSSGLVGLPSAGGRQRTAIGALSNALTHQPCPHGGALQRTRSRAQFSVQHAPCSTPHADGSGWGPLPAIDSLRFVCTQTKTRGRSSARSTRARRGSL